MLMKPLTAALLLSIAVAGTACSDTVAEKTAAGTAPPAEADTAPAQTAETSASGTLNLNIGGQRDTAPRLLGQGAGQGGAIVGASGFGGGNFADAPELGIEIIEEDDPAAALLAPGTGTAPSDEDEIIRLPD